LAALPENPYVHAGLASFHALCGEWAEVRRRVIERRNWTPDFSDEWRLWELNNGPNDQPLPNRLGKGLRLALEFEPESLNFLPAVYASSASAEN
jgi:hypothetical protein